MTTIDRPAGQPATIAAPRSYRKGSLLADWLSSTDHKVIGHLYLITSFIFFLIAGLMAMIMRIQLFGPDNHIVSDTRWEAGRTSKLSLRSGRKKFQPRCR